MADAIENELNTLMTSDGLPPLNMDASDPTVRDRRRFFVAIARGVVAHLEQPEGRDQGFLRAQSNQTRHRHRCGFQLMEPGRPYFDFPFTFDERGRSAVTDADDHVRDLIYLVLFTSPGERVNRPEFGCGVKQLLFAPLSDALVGGDGAAHSRRADPLARSGDLARESGDDGQRGDARNQDFLCAA